MQIRTVQWNIGGAHIRTPNDDAGNAGSYANENLAYIFEKLSSYSPDIITLQESHADDSNSQAQLISEQLGLPYFVNDAYDASHIAPGQKLCQSIISRFPIKDHSFSFFYNPHYRKIMEDGTEWKSHDKGISTVVVDVEGTELIVQTLHLIPFRKFGIDTQNEEGQKIVSSIEKLIEKERSPYLLQGDFNSPGVTLLLPNLASAELYERGGDIPTTPKGRIYDHVLFRGLRQTKDTLIDSETLTDHYPLISQFEL